MDQPTSILDIPLDVWGWYGDAVFIARMYRVCCHFERVKLPEKTATLSHLGLHQYTTYT